MARPPVILETERLSIRRLRPGDARIIFENWARDEDVTRFLVWKPHRSLDESVEHAVRCEEEWERGIGFTWILEDRSSATPVGSIAAHPSANGISLGYLLARSAWGQGYMAEAVTCLTDWFLKQPDVHRIWAVCDVENEASSRVPKGCGFDLEGRLRRWLVHPNIHDEPRDVLCFSVVKE